MTSGFDIRRFWGSVLEAGFGIGIIHITYLPAGLGWVLENNRIHEKYTDINELYTKNIHVYWTQHELSIKTSHNT